MSDVDDLALDRAFESLTRDLAHTHGPGAAAAMRTARRRRRTRAGTIALAALVVVGGGLAVPRLVPSGDGVAAGGASARLDASALATATEGWTSGWEMWERYSPKGGGSFSTASCSYVASSDGDVGPEPASRGTSRFVGDQRSSGVLVVERYEDPAAAASSQDLSVPPPDTCGTTTTYDVDGVQVRHDSMPPEGTGGWLGDIWSVQIGADRAQLDVVTEVGVADDASARRVAEALVAGLRDGWTQSGTDPVVPQPQGKGQLPDWPDVDLDDALAGWQAASRSAASGWPNTPCLGEMLTSDAVSTSAGGTPRGVTHRIVGFDDETTGPAKVETMLSELRACADAGMEVETLPNGVHLATYDTGGGDGRGALWFAVRGDRAGLIGVDGADRPMPMGAREDVADALYTVLRLPWE